MDISQLPARPDYVGVCNAARYLEGFANEMASAGYAPLTIRAYLDSAIHFGKWAEAGGLNFAETTDESINAFGKHRCKCPGRHSHQRLLEKERNNCARTRNSRLAAIKTFFKFLEYRLPSCLEQAQRIRAIPVKKTDEVIIGYLNREEIQALLDAPDPNTPYGLRDRARLHLAFAGGLRVSELVGLNLADLTLHTQSSVHVMGKGRRERILPLWKETAGSLRDWLKARGEPKATALFQNARGELMTGPASNTF